MANLVKLFQLLFLMTACCSFAKEHIVVQGNSNTSKVSFLNDKKTMYKSHEVDGTKFYFAVSLPRGYDPNYSYPVHIFLHGLVNREKRRLRQAIDGGLKKLTQDNSISIFPMAWKEEPWWSTKQIKNIEAIVKWIKKTYQVDENKVFLHGVSDGAHGAYYIMAHSSDLFAGVIPMIGSPFVLSTLNDGNNPTFLTNLINKPMLIFHGTRDELYSHESIKTFSRDINKAGGSSIMQSINGGRHNLRWYEEYKNEIDDFVNNVKRETFPDRIYWEVSNNNFYNRHHWLVINEVRNTQQPKYVNIEKKGNVVFIDAPNIEVITLLISSEHFDFNSNIKIFNSGYLLHDAKLKLDPVTSNKWKEIDNDSSQIYYAELKIELTQERSE